MQQYRLTRLAKAMKMLIDSFKAIMVLQVKHTAGLIKFNDVTFFQRIYHVAISSFNCLLKFMKALVHK